MPRIKKEKNDFKQIKQAADTLLSYKDRLDDWRKQDAKQKGQILRDAYQFQSSWNCISSRCGKPLMSAAGMQYHLDRCGIVKGPQEKKERRKRGKYQRRELDEPETAFDAEIPNIEREDLEPDEEEQRPRTRYRNSTNGLDPETCGAGDDDDYQIDNETPKKYVTRELAVQEYLSYADRLDDWRKLTNKEQSRVLRYIYLSAKGKKWKCLSSSCGQSFGTYPGLQYHMKRCGLSVQDRETKCPICGDNMPKAKVPEHVIAVHGHSALFYHSKPRMNSSKKKNVSATGNESMVDSEQSMQADTSMAVDDSDCDRSSATLIRRKRCHISLARVPFSEYRLHMAQVYEKFKASIRSDDHHVNFLRHGVSKAEWPMLEENECDIYTPYSDHSIRFGVEGVHEKNEVVSLNWFEVLPTPKGFIAFCGSAITVCAWCPIDSGSDNQSDQYLLLGLSNDALVADEENLPGSLQLWKLSTDESDFQLQYVIAHDYGNVFDARWCPSSQYMRSELQLGLLAVTSSVGEVGVYRIPLPEPNDEYRPTVYKPTPDIRLYSGANCLIYSVDWSPYRGNDEIVAGLADGTLVAWKLSKRQDSNMLDDRGRLLPILCVEVANAPVRFVRWWSEDKVMVLGLDRQAALWDLRSGSCVAKYPVQGPMVSFECPGYYFPAVSFGSDAVLGIPSTTFVDFVSSAVRSTMPLATNHSTAVWGISFNPWTGENLTVDDVGTVSRSCVSILDALLDSKRRRYIDEIVLKSAVQSDEEIYDYVEAKRRCWLKFSFQNALPTRTAIEKESKEIGLSGQFPVAALFTVAWNPNKNSSRWCCFGGQNGLLHVMKFEN